MTTPMMAQWEECKAQAKDALLLFRLGDFYEAFYEDAKIIAKELHLTLTARQTIPMCGVPFHTAEVYVDKLTLRGFKVAIAEQTEDAKESKGLVRREVTRIITPGTVISSNALQDKKNNFFVSIVQIDDLFGLAAIDVTTAEFRVSEHLNEESLIDELCRLKPSEFLTAKPFSFLKELSFRFGFALNEKKELSPSFAEEVLTAHFNVAKLDSFGLRKKRAAISAAGSLMLYLKEELNLGLEQIHFIQTETFDEFMKIDRSSMKNLDIDPMLIDLLDETLTPMGGRMLRRWTQAPLTSVEKIEERQMEVKSFIENQALFQKVREHLSSIRDLERLMMRISANYASPRDVLALGLSLSHLPSLKELLKIDVFDASALVDKVLTSLSENPPLRAGDGSTFKSGVSEELDQLNNLCQDANAWMASYQLSLREKTGFKSLKVGYTKAFGYYIEVSRANGQKMPEEFERKQTLVNTERFITQELKNFEHQILSAEERIKALEIALFDDLKDFLRNYAGAIYVAAKKIAEKDVLLSFAKVAIDQKWNRPTLNSSDTILIQKGRHPVIENVVGESLFIPNDTLLTQSQQLMLITGPNMAGKSTYIRQVALIVILAQMGSFVPAERAEIGFVDQIFSRIGASDDLARGQSTFMVEMSETAHILNNASSRSLVLLDEIGRGTSTYDGISIAWAVAEYLLTTHQKKAKTLFATHYWELTELEKSFSSAKNFQTAIEERADGITFLRKIIPGGTDKSYGIHVAKLAGLPQKVIERAEKRLKELSKPETQLSLFELEEHPALSLLKQIEPTFLSLEEAKSTLLKLKEQLNAV